MQKMANWTVNFDMLLDTFSAHGIGRRYGEILEQVNGGPLAPEGSHFPLEKRQQLYILCAQALSAEHIPLPPLLPDQDGV